MSEKIENDARMVVAIWKEGSLSAAAARIGTSPASVTRKLSRLESDLGVILFERTTRAVRVTPAGEELAIRFERALNEIDLAAAVIQQQEEQVRGWVRVSVPPNLASVLGPIFRRFRSKHPDLQLRVRATEQRLVFAREEVDLLVRVGSLEEDGLVARPLTRYRHVICSHPALRQKLRRPGDLQRVPVAVWASLGPPTPWTLERDNDAIQISPTPSLVTNDYELIADAIENDHMVGELPALLATPLIESGRIARVLSRWHMPELDLSVLYPAHRLLPNGVRALIDHLREEFARIP